jgi:type I restriction enzyme S subunit
MQVKPGYKQTEVGVIPEEWDVRTLSQTAKRITRGASPRPIDSPVWFDARSSVGWVRISDVTRSGRYLTETTQRLSEAGIRNSRPVPSGSLIMSICATVGRPIETRIDACIHDGFVVFDQPAVHQSFLYHVLAALEPSWSKRGQTGSQMNLNTGLINGCLVPLPPTEAEQRAIAAALSDVDALLGGLDRLIAKKRDLKHATMQQLLTGETRLPGFSGAWEVKRLGEVADILKGSALSKSLIAASAAHPCILYGELFTTYGRVISNVVSRTNSSEGCRSVAGDVLLPGSTTTTGADLATASALLIEDVALGGDIIILRRKGDSSDPVFLASLLTHTARHEIAQLTQGITIHHLYGKDLRTLSLQLPSLTEQTAIAAVLSDMDAELAALEARRDKTRNLKQAMMQELLTGRTRLI